MTVKELISELFKFNPDADVNVIAHCRAWEFSIAWGSKEGCTNLNADEVSFYVDALCSSENQEVL